MIYKSKQTEKFTVLPNVIFEELNDGLAIGILAYLLSKPNDWVTYKQQLYSHFTEGRQRIDKSFKLLEEKGFIVGVQKVNNSGQFNGFEWIVYNEPVVNANENRLTENRLIENQQSENEQLLNKEYTKERNNKEISFSERKKKFIDWFNEQLTKNLNREGKFRTLSKQTENNLKKVLEINYSSIELTKAFKNMCKNEWVIENNQVTPDHFLRISNLEKYINQEEKNNNIYTPQLPLN
jgi:DNA-binding helix-hairpin-helix protein with protein kinase domain